MYTARYLGAEGFGLLSFALAFTGIFGVVTDLGLKTLTVREVARDKSLATQYLGNIIGIKAILSTFTLLLIAVIMNLIGYPDQKMQVVYILTFSILLTSYTDILYSIFQAYEKMEFQSFGQVLNSLIMLIGALLAIELNYDINGFAFIYFVSSFIVLIYATVVCISKFVIPKLTINFHFWKVTIKEALPFGLTGIFVTIYYWIDSVMLSFMQGDEAVGYYNAAYRLIMVLLFIPMVLNLSIFPAMSQFFTNNLHSFKYAYEKYFKYMAIIGFPIGVGTTLIAEEVIWLIFGKEFMNSVLALQILVWSSIFIYLNGSFGRLLEASNRQMVVTKITGICMIENILLNFIIIPKFSYIGASVTTVITEFTALILVAIICSKIGYGLSKDILLDVAKAIFASVIMGLIVIYLIDINIIVLILISAIFYFVIVSVIGGFDKDDVQLFKRIIGI